MNSVRTAVSVAGHTQGGDIQVTFNENKLETKQYVKQLTKDTAVLTNKGWIAAVNLQNYSNLQIFGLNTTDKTVLLPIDNIETFNYGVGKFTCIMNPCIQLTLPEKDLEIYCSTDEQFSVRKLVSECCIRKYSLNDLTDNKDITYDKLEKAIGLKEKTTFYELASQISYSQARTLLQKYLKKSEFISKDSELADRVGFLCFMAGFNIGYRRTPQGYRIKLYNHGVAECNNDSLYYQPILEEQNEKITKITVKSQGIYIRQNGQCYWI